MLVIDTLRLLKLLFLRSIPNSTLKAPDLVLANIHYTSSQVQSEKLHQNITNINVY